MSRLIAVRSVWRCLPLFVSARPGTPLRVLCVMAFDALHQIRCSEPMPAATHRVLAALLDFGACANAIIDDKPHCRRELERTRRILDDAGLHSFIEDVLRRLSDLEGRRPSPFGDDRHFHQARLYREAVARLWLETLAATAGIESTQDDGVLELLFRIVMQCQIIDDVLDYSRDASAGLPGFLTASASLPQAIERTYHAACEYARPRGVARSSEMLPLRAALGLASICARLMILFRIPTRALSGRRSARSESSPSPAVQSR